MFNKNKQKQIQRQNITLYILDDAFTVKHSIYNVLSDKTVVRNMDATFYPIGEGILFEELRDTLDKNKADLYLLDTELEDGSGWDLVPLIKEKYPDAHIIMLSDGLNPKLKAKREQYESLIFSIIEKPFQPGIVIGVLNELVAFINSSKQLSSQSRKNKKHEQSAVSHLTSNTFAPTITKEKSKIKERKLSGLSVINKQQLESESLEPSPVAKTTPTDIDFFGNDFNSMSHLPEDATIENENETKNWKEREPKTNKPLFDFVDEPNLESEKNSFTFNLEPVNSQSDNSLSTQKEPFFFDETIGKKINSSKPLAIKSQKQEEEVNTFEENSFFNFDFEDKKLINDDFTQINDGNKIINDVFTIKNEEKNSLMSEKTSNIDLKHIINDGRMIENDDKSIISDGILSINDESELINDVKNIKIHSNNLINDLELSKKDAEIHEKSPKFNEKAVSFGFTEGKQGERRFSRENDRCEDNSLDFLFAEEEEQDDSFSELNNETFLVNKTEEEKETFDDDLNFSFNFADESVEVKSRSEEEEKEETFDFLFDNESLKSPKEKDNSFDFNEDDLDSFGNEPESDSTETFDFDFSKNSEEDFFAQPSSLDSLERIQDEDGFDFLSCNEVEDLNEDHSELDRPFEFSITNNSFYEESDKEEKNQSVTPENFDLEFVLSENKSKETHSSSTDDLFELFDFEEESSLNQMEGPLVNFEYLKEEDSYSEEPNAQSSLHQEKCGLEDEEDSISFLFDDTSSFESEEADEEIENDDDEDDEEEFFIRPPMRRW